MIGLVHNIKFRYIAAAHAWQPAAAKFSTAVYTPWCTASCVPEYGRTASSGNNGVGTADCDSRRAVGPIRTIRGVF